MHENLSITDGVYGILSEADVREQINELSKKTNIRTEKDIDEIIALIIDRLKNRPHTTS